MDGGALNLVTAIGAGIVQIEFTIPDHECMESSLNAAHLAGRLAVAQPEQHTT
jgi:hypothetical protein